MVDSVSLLVLERNHTFIGSFFPFMGMGPRYSRWNWGSAFSADCKHLKTRSTSPQITHFYSLETLCLIGTPQKCVGFLICVWLYWLKTAADRWKKLKGRSNLPVSIFRDINFPLFTSCFSTTCEVDCISKQAISRHPLTDHPCHHLPRVDPDCDLDRIHNKKNMILIVVLHKVN